MCVWVWVSVSTCQGGAGADADGEVGRRLGDGHAVVGQRQQVQADLHQLLLRADDLPSPVVEGGLEVPPAAVRHLQVDSRQRRTDGGKAEGAGQLWERNLVDSRLRLLPVCSPLETPAVLDLQLADRGHRLCATVTR